MVIFFQALIEVIKKTLELIMQPLRALVLLFVSLSIRAANYDVTAPVGAPAPFVGAPATVQVGDTITFQSFGGSHAAVDVDKATFDSCNGVTDTMGALTGLSSNTDGYMYTFSSPGTLYIICPVGNGAHCRAGMTFSVTVTDAPVVSAPATTTGSGPGGLSAAATSTAGPPAAAPSSSSKLSLQPPVSSGAVTTKVTSTNLKPNSSTSKVTANTAPASSTIISNSTAAASTTNNLPIIAGAAGGGGLLLLIGIGVSAFFCIRAKKQKAADASGVPRGNYSADVWDDSYTHYRADPADDFEMQKGATSRGPGLQRENTRGRYEDTPAMRGGSRGGGYDDVPAARGGSRGGKHADASARGRRGDAPARGGSRGGYGDGQARGGYGDAPAQGRGAGRGGYEDAWGDGGYNGGGDKRGGQRNEGERRRY
ncbi:hypothetical protein BC830DRAFT_1147054 [Chytriomyces sp. MP71]|nr:hypothetical protein BC830DRAFT_1147054 [Chytriomyces sp. MP71]